MFLFLQNHPCQIIVEPNPKAAPIFSPSLRSKDRDSFVTSLFEMPSVKASITPDKNCLSTLTVGYCCRIIYIVSGRFHKMMQISEHAGA